MGRVGSSLDEKERNESGRDSRPGRDRPTPHVYRVHSAFTGITGFTGLIRMYKVYRNYRD